MLTDFIEESLENFYEPEQAENFYDVLAETQEALMEKYSELLLSEKKNERQIKDAIEQHLKRREIAVDGFTMDELTLRLYGELAEYSFLTDYLKRSDIEEININAWNDIKISYKDGSVAPSEEIFSSANHALTVIRRLLHHSKMIIDASSPIVRGHLANNIRITSFAPPVIDDDVGVAASIRIVNPMELTEKDFIENGTSTEAMLDFLSEALNAGVSICSCGATSSGKTTLMSYLLSNVPDEKRIVTIENEVREFNLIRADISGGVRNNVIHLVSKESKENIRQEKLLEYALTANPDIICVAEAKSSEAFQAQEAARTGHAVITTVHANSCEEAYYRLFTLCKQKSDIGDDLLYRLISDAFPIMFCMKRFSDNKRRIIEIAENITTESGGREIVPLFKWSRGEGFAKSNEPSKALMRKIAENG